MGSLGHRDAHLTLFQMLPHFSSKTVPYYTPTSRIRVPVASCPCQHLELLDFNFCQQDQFEMLSPFSLYLFDYQRLNVCLWAALFLFFNAFLHPLPVFCSLVICLFLVDLLEFLVFCYWIFVYMYSNYRPVCVLSTLIIYYVKAYIDTDSLCLKCIKQKHPDRPLSSRESLAQCIFRESMYQGLRCI